MFCTSKNNCVAIEPTSRSYQRYAVLLYELDNALSGVVCEIEICNLLNLRNDHVRREWTFIYFNYHEFA